THRPVAKRHAGEIAESVIFREWQVWDPTDLFEVVADFQPFRRLPIAPFRADPPVVRRGHDGAPVSLQAHRRPARPDHGLDHAFAEAAFPGRGRNLIEPDEFVPGFGLPNGPPDEVRVKDRGVRGEAVRAPERAAEVRIARPVEAAAAYEARRRAED